MNITIFETEYMTILEVIYADSQAQAKMIAKRKYGDCFDVLVKLSVHQPKTLKESAQ